MSVLTILSLKLCFLHGEIIDDALAFISFRPQFTYLIFKSAAHFF